MPQRHYQPVLQLSDRLSRLQYAKEQSRILVFHCRYLISHLSVPLSEGEGFPTVVQSIEATVTHLSEKPFPWCLLRQQTIRHTLLRIKSDLVFEFNHFGLDADTIETDFIKAQQQDRETLRTRCRSLSRSPDLAAHLVAAGGDRYQTRELMAAFSKHVHNCNNSLHVTDEVEDFIRTAAIALHRCVSQSTSAHENTDISSPSWNVTSLEVDFDLFDEKKLVGRGAFGRVVEGTWWKGSGGGEEVVAVKGLHVKSTEEVDKRRAFEAFKNEVQVWSRLSHPNILPFLGASLDSVTPFILSKLCPAGHALTYLRLNSNADRVRLLLDAALALIYLHSIGIIHGDVKATNILISKSEEEKPSALLTDFGLSTVYEPPSAPLSPQTPSHSKNSTDSTFSSVSNSGQSSSFFKSVSQIKRPQKYRPVGTPRWMAPEVIRGRGLSTAADVYGFGMVGWEILSVRAKATDIDAERALVPDVDTYQGLPLPFGSVKDPNEVCALVVRGQRPKRPPRGRGVQNPGDEDRVWEVIERCWKSNPLERPDFRWVESVLEGLMKRAGGRTDRKKKKWSIDLSSSSRTKAMAWPWKRASSVENAGGVANKVSLPLPPPSPPRIPPPLSPAVFEHPDFGGTEVPISSHPRPRPRRNSVLKALANLNLNLNLNVLSFSRSPSSSSGTKRFEWYSRGKNPASAMATPNPSNTSFDSLVASARALPSISRSSSLSRSNSQTRKLRRRRGGKDLSRGDASQSEDHHHHVTNKDGPEDDLVNGTDILTELFNLSLTSEGGLEITREGKIIPAILAQLKLGSHEETVEVEGGMPDENRPLTSGILANLACHGQARVYLIVQADLVPALMSCLSLSATAPVQENATRCLYNLSTSTQTHRLFTPRHGKEGLIFAMSKLLLSDSFSLNMARNVFGCFTNLSHKEMGGSSILATPEALDALVRTLILPGHPDDVDEVAKEQALMCLGNLSVDERGILGILAHPDLINGLGRSLCNSRNCHPIKAQALRCARNIARSASDHAEILRFTDITFAVSNVLGALPSCTSNASVATPQAVSSQERRYALHFAHRMSGSTNGRAWLKHEIHSEEYSGLREGLRWLADYGSSDEQVRAGECLRVSEIIPL